MVVGGGGGLCNLSGNPIIVNNVFSKNSANGGGGLFDMGGSSLIRNNTFISNSADQGGGLFIPFLDGASPISIQNNIMANNTASEGGGFYIYFETPTVLDYNDVWNNTGGDYYSVTPGAHDISADPWLVDPENGDFRLASGSPCIDAGDPDHHPETDFEGDPRPMGMTPDIGADETLNLHLTLAVTPAEALPGEPVIYNITLVNLVAPELTNVLLTDTLLAESIFTGYQADGFTCVHDGSAWGGELSCTLDSLRLALGESRDLTVTVMLSDTISKPQYEINQAFAVASAGANIFQARDQARTWVPWCAVQLNDMPMGSNLQAAIDASTQTTDIVKVSGRCVIHDLNLSKTLILQGGWTGDFIVRNPVEYPTTLNGQHLGRIILIDGNANPTVEDFIFTEGETSGDGGGVSVLSGSPIIRNNTFTNNLAKRGSGLYNGSGNPTIQNNSFAGNWNASHGGGLYNENGSPTVQDNTFTDNSASRGGGIYNGSGNPTIQNNTFIRNSYNFGGGLYNASGSPIIQDNTFSGNAANFFGGGIYNETGSPLIQDNLFSSNVSTYYDYHIGQNGSGGGVWSGLGSPSIINLLIT